MNLSTEQLRAVAGGQALRLHAENTEMILVRADLYEAVRSGGLGEEVDVRPFYPLVNEAMREDDENDPLLESYRTCRR